MGEFAKSARLPLWIKIPFVLIIALILWFGVLVDPAGRWMPFGAGAIVYVVVVVGGAALLAYLDWKGDSSEHDRALENKGRRKAAVR